MTRAARPMFKRYLVAGLLVWLPLAVTLWVLDFIVTTMDRTLLLLPETWQPDRLLGMHVPGFGLVLSLAILLATGFLAANIIGQRMLAWWEGLLARIPVVRSIYSSVRQVSHTLFSQQNQSFRKVVLVEFPQRGQWTMGLVIGSPGPRIAADTGAADLLTVYVPTAPNPTSGYVLMVRPGEVRETDLSVDDALKFHVSLGVVLPATRSTRSALTTEGPGVPPDPS